MAAPSRIIRLIAADKSPLVLRALRQLFGEHPQLELVATAEDGERLLEAVERFDADIVILGWEMPYMGGRKFLEALRQKKRRPRIVVYTGSRDPEVPRLCLELGAAGFCSKADPPERLVECVLAVAEGRMVFPFIDLRTAQQRPIDTLTERERELLAALATGRNNAEIARGLGIKLDTVKFHLKNVYEKLGVKNRAQAVAMYLQGGGGS